MKKIVLRCLSSFTLFLIIFYLDSTNGTLDTVPSVVKSIMRKSNYSKTEPPQGLNVTGKHIFVY